MEAIRMDNVTRRFGNVTAVERLSLSVAGGELFGLVGPDGAGKTTAMRMLAATMDPTEGDVWVAGNHSTREPDAIKDSIAYMSQRFGLYSDLTVMQNINFYADIYGVPRKGRGEKIEDLLAFSNLTPFKKRPAGKLSGGMKQKLGLACALVHTPKVLLLDEPTNGVDPVSRRDFWRILYQLVREGVTIFVSTAYLDEAERCERLALLHKGHLMAVGTPEEVKSLIRGSILEVRSSEPRRAASVLRKALPGRQAGLFGDRVHLATANPEADKTAAAAALSDAGIAVEDIRAVTPSLEDVFISVIADEEKGTADE